MQDSWLVPFEDRNSSREYHQNFLWQYESIYIMDNHRAALWCWLQHLSKSEKYNLFHIDRHYDTLSSRIEEWISNAPDFEKQTISEFLDYTYQADMCSVPLVRYDNYLSIFLAKYKSYVNQCIFATHSKDRMDPPDFSNYQEFVINKLPDMLDICLSESNRGWIFNLDFDYFFCDRNDGRIIMLSDDYIKIVFEVIRKKYNDGIIKVLTVCLSPEWCGGWEASEQICEKFCKIMGLTFTLPQ